MAVVKQAAKKDFFGFSEPFNGRLFKWLAIPWFIFCLSRLPGIDVKNWFCGPRMPGVTALPGECYYYLNIDRMGWGIFLHLSSVLPAGALAALQFTPALRTKYRRFHRIAGYVATTLAFSGIASALLIVDKSFGGQTETIFASLTMGPSAAYALYRAIAAARAKQIASHRDWMLRAWLYLGTILVMRVCLAPLVLVISTVPIFRQHITIPCEVIIDILDNNTTRAYEQYPLCDPAHARLNPTAHAIVPADIRSSLETERTAAFHSVFGTAMWIAILINFVGIELYLRWERESKQKLKGPRPEGKAALNLSGTKASLADQPLAQEKETTHVQNS